MICDTFLPPLIQAIFGRYISEGSSCSIECSMDVIDIISFNLKPAYEDLFDLAEEHAVELLLVQWNVLCTQETNTFQQVQCIEAMATYYLYQSYCSF